MTATFHFVCLSSLTKRHGFSHSFCYLGGCSHGLRCPLAGHHARPHGEPAQHGHRLGGRAETALQADKFDIAKVIFAVKVPATPYTCLKYHLLDSLRPTLVA